MKSFYMYEREWAERLLAQADDTEATHDSAVTILNRHGWEITDLNYLMTEVQAGEPGDGDLILFNAIEYLQADQILSPYNIDEYQNICAKKGR